MREKPCRIKHTKNLYDLDIINDFKTWHQKILRKTKKKENWTLSKLRTFVFKIQSGEGTKKSLTTWKKIFSIIYLIKDLYPKNFKDTDKKTNNSLKSRYKIWRDPSPAKIYKWQRSTLHVQQHLSFGCYRLKTTLRYQKNICSNIWTGKLTIPSAGENENTD